MNSINQNQNKVHALNRQTKNEHLKVYCFGTQMYMKNGSNTFEKNTNLKFLRDSC